MLLNNLGASSTYRNIREDVKLFPYTIKIQQGHRQANKTKRIVFCSDFKMFGGENPAVPGSIWFGDKPHFHLNGYVNQLNICAWDIEQLYNIMQAQLRPEKMHDAVCSVKKLHCWTYICRRHCNYWWLPSCLPRIVPSFPRGMGLYYWDTFFQHDGVWPPTFYAVLDMLNDESNHTALSDLFRGLIGYGSS